VKHVGNNSVATQAWHEDEKRRMPMTENHFGKNFACNPDN
jgi:hypothetical protein